MKRPLKKSIAGRRCSPPFPRVAMSARRLPCRPRARTAGPGAVLHGPVGHAEGEQLAPGDHG